MLHSLVCPSGFWLFGEWALCSYNFTWAPLFFNIPYYFRKHIRYISLTVNRGRNGILKSFTAEKECLTCCLLNWKSVLVFTCLCVYATCARVPMEAGGGCQAPGATVIGICYELLDVGAGSRTWVLWEHSFQSLGLSPDLSETLVHVKIPTKSHNIDQPPGSTLEL